MLPEIGHFALCLALAVAILQATVPLFGVWRNDARLMQLAHSATWAQSLLLSFAFVVLIFCFVNYDFSVAYVAQNSNKSLPLIYRIAAVWGAHEGSLLLWVLMLSLWTLAVSIFSKKLPNEVTTLVLSILGWVSVGFLLFLVLTSNPFARLFPTPLDGRDLNPLLQDPGLIIHPPMLYMGYVGFAVAFAFALAALIHGKVDLAWARWTRPWTSTAWLFLTFGITLGSWWAYNELGWGGWWFWDPVENASFLPWLVGAALIHSLAMTEKRGLVAGWTVLLAIIAFSMSLLGTFLVRSGVLVSVHAFASDPTRGVFVLGLLTFFVGGALLLYAWRAPNLPASPPLRWVSREGAMLFNNILLVLAAFIVLLGTLYPLIADALFDAKVSVGKPYFDALFPVAIVPLMLISGLIFALKWKKTDLNININKIILFILFSIILGIILPYLVVGKNTVLTVVGVSLAAWVMFGNLAESLKYIQTKTKPSAGVMGMWCAHLGFGVTALGIVMVSAFSVEKDVSLKLGARANITQSLQIQFDDIKAIDGANYDANRATLSLWQDGKQITVLQPEKRFYASGGNAMTESGIHQTFFGDVYAALGEDLEEGAWSFRLYEKPFVRWIWFGGLLMMLGGILAASDRRYRLKSG